MKLTSLLIFNAQPIRNVMRFTDTIFQEKLFWHFKQILPSISKQLFPSTCKKCIQARKGNVSFFCTDVQALFLLCHDSLWAPCPYIVCCQKKKTGKRLYKLISLQSTKQSTIGLLEFECLTIEIRNAEWEMYHAQQRYSHTPLLRTLSMAPSVPVLTGFDCNYNRLEEQQKIE